MPVCFVLFCFILLILYLFLFDHPSNWPSFFSFPYLFSSSIFFLRFNLLFLLASPHSLLTLTFSFFLLLALLSSFFLLSFGLFPVPADYALRCAHCIGLEQKFSQKYVITLFLFIAFYSSNDLSFSPFYFLSLLILLFSNHLSSLHLLLFALSFPPFLLSYLSIYFTVRPVVVFIGHPFFASLPSFTHLHNVSTCKTN